MKKACIILSVLLALTTCKHPSDFPSDFGGEDEGDGTLIYAPTPLSVLNISRYEAIPDNSPSTAKIKYSYSYDGYDFYYIYLGKLKNIPLFYKDAYFHDWNYTSHTYTFETSNITQETISNTISTSSENAISVSQEHTVSKTDKVKVGFEYDSGPIAKFFGGGVKIKGEYAWEQTIADSSSTGLTKSTSLTKTEDYGKSQTNANLERREWNLTRADKEGYYRFTYFMVSDVYLFAVRDSTTKKTIYHEFKEHIIPGENFWGLDYSKTSSFEKSDLTGFEVDLSLLNNLPDPDPRFKFGNLIGDTPPLYESAFIVTNRTEWNTVLGIIKKGGNGTAGNPKTYTITVSGNIPVSGSNANSFGDVSNITIKLDGKGKLYLTSQGCMLTIGSYQTVILDSSDLTLQGLKDGQNGLSQNNNSSVVNVATNGTLVLNNGTISGNSCRDSFSTVVKGGGVYVSDNGKFTMSGGTISENSSGYRAISDGVGGGVHVSKNGSFTMSGGTISENSSYGGVGGIGLFLLIGPKGGGVYIDNNGNFTMSGGTISRNYCDPSLFTPSYGGGVFIGKNGSFTMSGGTISGNYCGTIGYGGGVYISSGTFNKSNSIIYGKDASNLLKNTPDAVYWADDGVSYYRDTTSGSGDTLSTSAYPLPSKSGQTNASGWTMN